jgi:nucleoside-diphosphate-sugar epimerase
LIKKKILATGTSGFIGKIFLKDALEKGYHVVDVLRFKNKKNKDLNLLRKNFSDSYKSIFYKNNKEIKKKLHNLKIDYFINFATLYKNDHNHIEIPKFIDSNIIFPATILDLIYMNVKKIINFGTMMQHTNGKDYIPKNFYASTKSALEMIINFYAFKNKNLRFYNIKFYESFSENDKRKKLIPTLIKNYKNNTKTHINSKRLELNIIHANDIIKSVYIILKNNFKSGSYCLKQNKNVKISKLITKLNKKLNKKLKVKYINNKFDKITKSKIKTLTKWKPDRFLVKKIIDKFYNENN